MKPQPTEPEDIEYALDSIREVRQVLNSVLSVLDKIETKLSSESLNRRTSLIQPRIINEIDNYLFDLNYTVVNAQRKLRILENRL